MKTELKTKDKIEITKQQEKQTQKVFSHAIKPKRNHTLFEVDLKNKTIKLATFDHLPEIKWEDAVKGNILTNKKVTKKENCIYISALNEKNVRKILKRTYEIIL